jgi:hypothetical protein
MVDRNTRERLPEIFELSYKALSLSRLTWWCVSQRLGRRSRSWEDRLMFQAEGSA